VEVATGQASATASNRGDGPALALACGLLLLPFARAHRRKLFFAALLLVLLTAGVSSCTTSSGGTGGVPSGELSGSHTPPGTYTIPVTVTADGLSQQINLTLTVD
jgi:hypothetical protein